MGVALVRRPTLADIRVVPPCAPPCRDTGSLRADSLRAAVDGLLAALILLCIAPAQRADNGCGATRARAGPKKKVDLEVTSGDTL